MTEISSGVGAATLSSEVVAPLPPPGPIQRSELAEAEAHSSIRGLEFSEASQAQILRSHQRDASQIHRLTDLVSELIRSFAATRYLASRQAFVDLIVRGTYLFLTFGRNQQTLGEEYTDIIPYQSKSRRFPRKFRRLTTIFLLLLPSLITSYLSSSLFHPDNNEGSTLSRVKTRLKRFAESPFGTALPEIHMLAFLFYGKFFEFGRRLTGLSYISTLSPGSSRHRSYEPLAILMLLPLITRLLRARASSSSIESSKEASPTKAIQSPVNSSLPSKTKGSVLLGQHDYDTPNTYLSPEAQSLPERQCTLCLESRGTGEGSGGTVAVTECGHIFCWGCLGGLERMECPLCRQSLRMERLIAAYNL